MIPALSLPRSDQIFTHIDEVTGQPTILAVTRIAAHMREIDHPHVRIPLTAEGAALMVRARGVEKHRLRRLTVLCARYPLLVLEWTDGTHLLADGTHSYVWQYTHGGRSALAWMVPEALWQPFIVGGLSAPTEEKLLSSFSGIR